MSRRLPIRENPSLALIGNPPPWERNPVPTFIVNAGSRLLGWTVIGAVTDTVMRKLVAPLATGVEEWATTGLRKALKLQNPPETAAVNVATGEIRVYPLSPAESVRQAWLEDHRAKHGHVPVVACGPYVKAGPWQAEDIWQPNPEEEVPDELPKLSRKHYHYWAKGVKGQGSSVNDREWAQQALALVHEASLVIPNDQKFGGDRPILRFTRDFFLNVLHKRREGRDKPQTSPQGSIRWMERWKSVAYKGWKLERADGYDRDHRKQEGWISLDLLGLFDVAWAILGTPHPIGHWVAGPRYGHPPKAGAKREQEILGQARARWEAGEDLDAGPHMAHITGEVWDRLDEGYGRWESLMQRALELDNEILLREQAGQNTTRLKAHLEKIEHRLLRSQKRERPAEILARHYAVEPGVRARAALEATNKSLRKDALVRRPPMVTEKKARSMYAVEGTKYRDQARVERARKAGTGLDADLFQAVLKGKLDELESALGKKELVKALQTTPAVLGQWKGPNDIGERGGMRIEILHHRLITRGLAPEVATGRRGPARARTPPTAPRAPRAPRPRAPRDPRARGGPRPVSIHEAAAAMEGTAPVPPVPSRGPAGAGWDMIEIPRGLVPKFKDLVSHYPTKDAAAWDLGVTPSVLNHILKNRQRIQPDLVNRVSALLEQWHAGQRVPILLSWGVQHAGGVRQLSEQVGVSPGHLGNLLAGRRKPGKKVLATLFKGLVSGVIFRKQYHSGGRKLGAEAKQAVAELAKHRNPKGSKKKPRKRNRDSKWKKPPEALELDVSEVEDNPTYEKAAKGYRKFHKTDPGRALVIQIPDGKKEVTRDPTIHVALGERKETPYEVPWESSKAGVLWYHEHPEESPPLMILNPETGIVSDVGGTYLVDEWFYS